MSPWVDDPETGTSHYEKPKRRSNREHLDQAMALRDLATVHNAEQQLRDDGTIELGADPATVESFGAKMARLKAEKKAAQQAALDVIAKLESLEVQGS